MNAVLEHRKRLMEMGGLLPSGYTKLTWLTNSGGSWFNSGVRRSTATSQIIDIECDIIITSNSSTGYMGGDNGTYFGISNLKWSNSGLSQGDIMLGQAYHVLMYRESVNTQLLYVDDTLVSTNSRTLSAAADIYIFNIMTSSAYQIKGSLGRTKIFKARELVRDFIPCIDPNNVYGMYDIINGQFYSSMTSTPFTGA